jgi:DNA replication protein DnaC
MNDLLKRMRAAGNPNVLKIRFRDDQPPRKQIEEAISQVPPRKCKYHPQEVRCVDKAATIREALYCEYPHEEVPHCSKFSATYERCSQCPHNDSVTGNEASDCPSTPLANIGGRLYPRDEDNKPVPRSIITSRLDPKLSVKDQFANWLAGDAKVRCPKSNQELITRSTNVTLPFEEWYFEVHFAPCLRCELESLKLSRDQSIASFENFLVNPPELHPYLEACQAFAANPQGVLLLLGHVGTGKTHLAISIMRERIRRGYGEIKFVKHRDFVSKHWLSLRPVPFGEESPESPLKDLQEVGLMVYDELAPTADGRSCEDVLLELFEYRIGRHKPAIITSNLNRSELEALIGTRLFDRLRLAAFQVLEFNFESKRRTFNADYLHRCRTDKP